MATNPRENSRGECNSIETSERLAYAGNTSLTIVDTPAGMVEHLYMQESLHSLPGSVPSGPHDGLVREPLCQEDTRHSSAHTPSQYRQSRISELDRIWEGTKSLSADTAISLKYIRDDTNGHRTGFAQRCRAGDVPTVVGGTLVLPPLNGDDVKHHFREVKGFPGISDLVKIIEHGVPVVTSFIPTNPRQALQYGNYSSVQEDRFSAWKKL